MEIDDVKLTIEQIDIPSFKKDSDISSNLAIIFNTSASLEQEIIDEKLIIILNENVHYVHPLFLIHLMSIHRQKNITLIFDIIDATKAAQQYILRYMSQYTDLDIVVNYPKETYNKTTGKYENAENELHNSLINNPKARKENHLKRPKDKKFHLFYTEKMKKSTLENGDKKLNFLPILQLKKYCEYRNEDISEIYENIGKRIDYYKKFDIELDYNKYKERLSENIDNLLNILSIDKSLSLPLSNVFSELIDNIKRYTSDDSSGYISLFKNSERDEYELIVADDNREGFLVSYERTLSDEKRKLIEEGVENIDSTILAEYTKTLEELKINNHSSVLEKLFNIETTLTAHQIPRVVMHFGIPTLLEMVKELNGTLDIFLNKGDTHFYHVSYDYTGTLSTAKPINPIDSKIYGTYIRVSFPVGSSIKVRESNQETVSLNLRNKDYQSILNNKTQIKEAINKFQYIDCTTLGKMRDASISSSSIILNFTKKYLGKNKSLSDFIRDVYLFSYIHKIEDIVVTNFPLDTSKHNLSTVGKIIFKDEEKVYEKPLNIAFYSDRSVRVYFIGGKDKKQFNDINNSLISTYNQEDHNDKFENISRNSPPQIDSSLFFKLTSEQSILIPFELFDIVLKDNNIYSIFSNLLKTYLEDTARTVHIDTLKDYHLNKQFRFKNIFKNSQWLHRIAFRMADNLEESFPGNEIFFIGTSQYSNQVLSILSSFLSDSKNETHISEFHSIYNFNEKNLKQLDIKVELAIKNDMKIAMYSPVVFRGKDITTYILDKYTDDISPWIKTIKLKIEKSAEKEPHTELVLDADSIVFEKPFNSDNKEFCKFCITDDFPLYKIDKNNPFTLEDDYEKDYRKKMHTGYCEENNRLPYWLNSIYFVHAKRGNNHYSYYTKTIPFFNDNVDTITEYLYCLKDKLLSGSSYLNCKDNLESIKGKVLLISPLHDTNNNFLTLVNKIIFNNNATILSIDINKAEENFYTLEQLNIDSNTQIFFVDDEISSGYTLRYFYSLLKVIIGEDTVKFEGIITLIDRTSLYDENIIKNYLNNNTLDNYHCFTILEIKPMKTDFGGCFLCDRQLQYLDLFEHVGLDLLRFQIVDRVSKLKQVDADEIEYDNSEKFDKKLKNFIKMFAVHYIYSKFDFSDNYKLLLDGFFSFIYKSLIVEFGTKLSTEEKNLIKKIIRREANIALLKALSFPKLVYHEKLRKLIAKQVISELNRFLYKTYPSYLEFDETFLTDSELKILNTANNYSKNGSTFLETYIKKVNIHYLNFLYNIAGYLNMNTILSIEHIRYYYELTQSDLIDTKLLHAYIFSTKMVTSYSEAKMLYFNRELKQFYSKYLRSKENLLENALFNALYIETRPTQSIVSFKNVQKIQGYLNNNKENILLPDNKLVEKVRDDFLQNHTLEIEYLFVNENFDRRDFNYPDYLDRSVLRDVKNNYTNLNIKNGKLYEEIDSLYYGAKADDTCEIITLKKSTNIKDDINDTWANNMYIEDNCAYTIIRLVDVDKKKIEIEKKYLENSTLWFKPLGCIVIKHKYEKVLLDNFEKDGKDIALEYYKNHLNITKYVLGVQHEIVDYIKNEFTSKSVQEKVHTKKIEEDNFIIGQKNIDLEEKYKVFGIQENEARIQMKNDLNKAYLKQITYINHSVKDYIDLTRPIDVYLKNKRNTMNPEDFLSITRIYSYGLYHLASIMSSEIKEDQHTKNLKTIDFFDSLKAPYPVGFHKDIIDFIDISYTFSTKLCKFCTKSTLDTSGLKKDSFKLKLKKSTHMDHIAFEFIFNALKYMPTMNDPFIKIYSLDDNSGIIIENPVEEYFSVKSMRAQIANNEGLGLSLIQAILKNDNYIMTFKKVKSSNLLQTIIKKETA